MLGILRNVRYLGEMSPWIVRMKRSHGLLKKKKVRFNWYKNNYSERRSNIKRLLQSMKDERRVFLFRTALLLPRRQWKIKTADEVANYIVKMCGVFQLVCRISMEVKLQL